MIEPKHERLSAIYQAPKTAAPHPTHNIYPYLLWVLRIERANQVWCTDIAYIPMARGFLYLVAIMDWASRKVLVWRLSNTMEPDFCVEALEEALARYGKPAIFNTAQGSQFTSLTFTQAFETGTQARAGISRLIDYYNHSRPHSSFDGRTPAEVYSGRDAPSPGNAPVWCQRHRRHENQHGIPPNKSRQAVQQLGATSDRWISDGTHPLRSTRAVCQFWFSGTTGRGWLGRSIDGKTLTFDL